MGNSKYKQSGNAQEDSGDPTDSEEPPGPASWQAQHLHWSPGPTTPGMRMRQTPANNIRDTLNTQWEPGGNAQKHPRSPPEVLGRVPKPASMTSTKAVNESESSRVICENHSCKSSPSLIFLFSHGSESKSRNQWLICEDFQKSKWGPIWRF